VIGRLTTQTLVTTGPRRGLPRPPAPLSARELDVLRLLGGDLDGPHIARRLSVSVNPVRTHTRDIDAELGVTHRRAAVRRGEELDLLPRHRDRPGRDAVSGSWAQAAVRLAGPAPAAHRVALGPGSPSGSPDMVIRTHHPPPYVPQHRRTPDLRP
jgi:DNA-binding CsgD family transcriptional regulator